MIAALLASNKQTPIILINAFHKDFDNLQISLDSAECLRDSLDVCIKAANSYNASCAKAQIEQGNQR